MVVVKLSFRLIPNQVEVKVRELEAELHIMPRSYHPVRLFLNFSIC